jgi:hypothetical protein
MGLAAEMPPQKAEETEQQYKKGGVKYHLLSGMASADTIRSDAAIVLPDWRIFTASSLRSFSLSLSTLIHMDINVFRTQEPSPFSASVQPAPVATIPEPSPPPTSQTPSAPPIEQYVEWRAEQGASAAEISEEREILDRVTAAGEQGLPDSQLLVLILGFSQLCALLSLSLSCV